MLHRCGRLGASTSSSGGTSQTGFLSILRQLRNWNKQNAAAAFTTAANIERTTPVRFLTSLLAPNSRGHPQDATSGNTPRSRLSKSALDAVEDVVRSRWTCRGFDPKKPIDMATLKRVLEATTRSPTGFNLQGWHAVVVTETVTREKLYQAALGQPQVLQAPATIVFLGDTEPERKAPQALEMGLETGYYGPYYGATYLRNIYYFMHGGPGQTMAAAKSMLSTWYSQTTSTPLVSVPVSRAGYAWKQTMIPATTFVQLATAAGWDTCMMEGIDEEAVKRLLDVPARFTVPVIVSVGYATEAEKERGKVRSSRFSKAHLIRWNQF